MVSPSHPRALHPLQALSIKSPASSSSSSSSTLSYMKIKTLIQTVVFSRVYRVIRALSKAKSILIQILREYVQPISPTKIMNITRKNKAKNKIFFGSFRLHYNWCSSHVLPVPAPVLDGLTATHLYYDSTWNSVISSDEFLQEEDDDVGESQLSGYLHWLEEKVRDNNNNNNSSATEQANANEIDRLADIFIANSHEKFRLEKQESYRRFQEMLARSM